jgi:hypothetical protein
MSVRRVTFGLLSCEIKISTSTLYGSED